jgi:hypothetical protein
LRTADHGRREEAAGVLEGYGRIQELGAEAVLRLPFDPTLEIRLADLG